VERNGPVPKQLQPKTDDSRKIPTGTLIELARFES
jgi:hypothetical protein